MAVLQIVGDRARAGKTSLAGALLLHLQTAGRKAAYFKPFTAAAQDDADVSFLSSGLLEDILFPEDYHPQQLPSSGADATTQTSVITDVAHQLEGQSDLVLVEGPDLTAAGGATSPVAMDLASALDSKVLLLFRHTPNLDSIAVAAATQPFGDRLAGVIINGVTAYRKHQVKETLAKELRGQGITFLGALPEDRQMLGVTVQQLADYLGGRWAQDPEDTGAFLERFLIGGNIMDSGATYFGRYSKQAVVTRAARPDIQMASLMSDVSCLVLTGGEEPTEYVKAEALQRGVPLLLVESDTMQTAEGLGGLLHLATVHSRHKIEHFLSLLQDNVDLNTLLPQSS